MVKSNATPVTLSLQYNYFMVDTKINGSDLLMIANCFSLITIAVIILMVAVNKLMATKIWIFLGKYHEHILMIAIILKNDIFNGILYDILNEI